MRNRGRLEDAEPQDGTGETGTPRPGLWRSRHVCLTRHLQQVRDSRKVGSQSLCPCGSKSVCVKPLLPGRTPQISTFQGFRTGLSRIERFESFEHSADAPFDSVHPGKGGFVRLIRADGQDVFRLGEHRVGQDPR